MQIFTSTFFEYPLTMHESKLARDCVEVRCVTNGGCVIAGFVGGQKSHVSFCVAAIISIKIVSLI